MMKKNPVILAVPDHGPGSCNPGRSGKHHRQQFRIEYLGWYLHPEGADGTVIVNGEDVTEEVKKNTFDNLPSPNEMTTPTTAPSTPAAVDLCKCVDLPTAEDHPGVCKVKAPYIALCSSASEPELYAKWASFSYDEQAFMRAYLQQTSPLKLVELERLLSVPNSSASETLSDGTTVSVEEYPGV